MCDWVLCKCAHRSFLVMLHVMYKSKPAQSRTKLSSLVKAVPLFDKHRARFKVFEELFGWKLSHFQSSSISRIRIHLSWVFRDGKVDLQCTKFTWLSLEELQPLWSYTSIHNYWKGKKLVFPQVHYFNSPYSCK